MVLARGLGTRMRRDDAAAALDGRQAAAANAGVKAMIPIAVGKGDRPFLDYVLSTVADAGYRRVCLVIGPEQEMIRRYYGGEVAAQRLAASLSPPSSSRRHGRRGGRRRIVRRRRSVHRDQFRQLLSY